MAAYFARMNSIEAASSPLHADGTFDPDALLACDPAVVYLCSPNNPTGAALDPDAVEHVIARARGVVIVDEAYAEFAGPGWLAGAPRRADCWWRARSRRRSASRGCASAGRAARPS